VVNSQNFPIFFQVNLNLRPSSIFKSSQHFIFLLTIFIHNVILVITKQNKMVNVADNEYTHQISPDAYVFSINMSVYMELKCIYFFHF
jgi:hypothetical protein